MVETRADSLSIRRPDDWHLHIRDGETMRAVLPFTAAQFARAIVMPNLQPPVIRTEDARAYRDRILAALPSGARFEPLMTAYLTDNTDPDDLARGFAEKVFTAAKLYPAHATTNSAHGVTDIANISTTIQMMMKMLAAIITRPLEKNSLSTSTSLVTRVTSLPIGLVS